MALIRRNGRNNVTLGAPEASWQTSDSGPRRKYFEVTASGRDVRAQQFQDWLRFRAGIDSTVAHAVAESGCGAQ